MVIMLEQLPIPETGYFEIDVQRTVEITVSAKQARKIAKKWAMDYVSCMMSAELPTLTLGEQTIWRVPITFYATRVGRVGVAGTVDVDVLTGSLLNREASKRSIIEMSQEMARKLPPVQWQQTVADEFIPKHIPQAMMAKLPEA